MLLSYEEEAVKKKMRVLKGKLLRHFQPALSSLVAILLIASVGSASEGAKCYGPPYQFNVVKEGKRSKDKEGAVKTNQHTLLPPNVKVKSLPSLNNCLWLRSCW